MTVKEAYFNLQSCLIWHFENDKDQNKANDVLLELERARDVAPQLVVSPEVVSLIQRGQKERKVRELERELAALY